MLEVQIVLRPKATGLVEELNLGSEIRRTLRVISDRSVERPSNAPVSAEHPTPSAIDAERLFEFATKPLGQTTQTRIARARQQMH